MSEIIFTVPKNTMVYFHKRGMGYNINENFGQRLTHKDATYDMSDVWFLPPDITTRHLPAAEIDAATPEGWPKALKRSIGFKVPDNDLDIDYIVVPFGSIKWNKTGDESFATTEAKKQLRRFQQNDPPFTGHL